MQPDSKNDAGIIPTLILIVSQMLSTTNGIALVFIEPSLFPSLFKPWINLPN